MAAHWEPATYAMERLLALGRCTGSHVDVAVVVAAADVAVAAAAAAAAAAAGDGGAGKASSPPGVRNVAAGGRLGGIVAWLRRAGISREESCGGAFA